MHRKYLEQCLAEKCVVVGIINDLGLTVFIYSGLSHLKPLSFSLRLELVSPHN